MPHQQLTVLLVEDNQGDARLVEVMLQHDASLTLVRVDRLLAALQHVQDHPVDVILLDLSLPDTQGIDSFRQLSDFAREIPIVVLSGTVDDAVALQAVQEGAQDSLVKGQVDGDALARAVRFAFERKQVERSLIEREWQMRAVFDQELQFAGILTPDGIIVDANQPALDFIGRQREDVLGRPFWETPWWQHDPEAQQRVKAYVAAAAYGGLIRDEFEHVGAQGQRITVDFSIKPVRNDAGRIVWLLPEGRDITERKLAEAQREALLQQLHDARGAAEANAQQLNALLTRYQALLQDAPDAILVFNRQGTIVEANRAAALLLKHSREQLLGRCLSQFGIAEPSEIERWVARVQTQGTWRAEIDLSSGNGSFVPVEVVAAAAEHPNGAVGQLALHDVSERRATDQLHQDFLAMVTHELRNPLAALMSWAQVLRTTGIPVERAATVIVDQAQHLDRLISDLLDVAQYDTGHLKLSPGEVDLLILVKSCMEQESAATNEHSFTLEAPKSLTSGSWDRDRIWQVVQNLLSNAVKYSPGGGRISVRIRDLGEHVELAVEDQGLGMAPEVLPQLFNRFFRVETTGGQVKGLGLGLYITKSIVEAHGGTIKVQSTLGEGSVFTVSLPYSRADSALSETKAPAGRSAESGES